MMYETDNRMIVITILNPGVLDITMNRKCDYTIVIL